MSSKKTLEINPHNPLIVELKNRVDKDPKDPNLKNSAELIFDSALMSSGFVHDDPLKLVRRIHSVLSKDFGVDVSSEVEAEEATPKESHDEEESEAVHDEL
jgi:HSP90 family molecular chaperone